MKSAEVRAEGAWRREIGWGEQSAACLGNDCSSLLITARRDAQ